MVLRENTIMFIDDSMITEQCGLSRIPTPAAKHPANPIIGRDNPWEAGNVYIFGSVLRDAETGLFRMWYQAIDREASTSPDHMSICYAESNDGIHWRKPLMPLVPYRHLKLTNIVLGNAIYPGNPYCSSVVFDPDAAPAERYKMLVWYEQWTDGLSRFNGAASFYSEDGLRWRVYPDAQPAINIPVRFENGKIARFESPNDANCVSPDRLDGEFVNWQVMRRKIPPAKRVYARDLMAGDRLERVLAMQTSRDFVHWSEPRDIIVPGPEDPDFIQFYSMGGFRYGNYWLGTLWVYYVHDQSMDVELALSRDGRRWTRPFPGRRLIGLGGDGDFDRGMMQTATAPLVVGDQICIYYGGEDHRHDEGGAAAIGLATLPLDRWAGLQTGQRGMLRTQPFTFRGAALELNAYAHGGEVRAELLDEAGQPLPGYGLEQSAPAVGDRTRHRLLWQDGGDLSALSGRRIAVRLELLNATVYSITAV
jgi:hypothetical protein